MEYALTRAMEVCRLNLEQIARLEARERALNRCLMPLEIQNVFQLDPLKITYEIPEDDSEMAKHSQRIRKEFYQHKIYPIFQSVSALDIDEIHKFDDIVRKLVVDEMQFELRFMGREAKTRLKKMVLESILFLGLTAIR